MTQEIAIILFVTIVALSTTLVIGKVMAEDCKVICLDATIHLHLHPDNVTDNFKDPTSQAFIDHQTYGDYVPSNATVGSYTTPTNDMTKPCQQTQDMINVNRDLGADPNTLADLQKLHDDTCN